MKGVLEEPIEGRSFSAVWQDNTRSILILISVYIYTYNIYTYTHIYIHILSLCVSWGELTIRVVMVVSACLVFPSFGIRIAQADGKNLVT